MNIELSNEELSFIAKALKAYADSLGETTEPLNEIEYRGRKLVHKLSDKVKDFDLEQLLYEARESFCGLGNDDELP